CVKIMSWFLKPSRAEAHFADGGRDSDDEDARSAGFVSDCRRLADRPYARFAVARADSGGGGGRHLECLRAAAARHAGCGGSAGTQAQQAADSLGPSALGRGLNKNKPCRVLSAGRR